MRVPVNTSPNNKKAATIGMISDKRWAASVATIPTDSIARPRITNTAGNKIPSAIMIPQALPSAPILLTSGFNNSQVNKNATGYPATMVWRISIFFWRNIFKSTETATLQSTAIVKYIINFILVKSQLCAFIIFI